jgi:hypothetical protein
LFCERCGQQFLPGESVCTRCRVSPTRHLLQLVSLVTLTVAVGWNSLLSLFFLPRLAAGEHAELFRAWLRMSNFASLYGWLVIALGILVWSFWGRHGCQLQRKEWVARFFLFLLLLGAGVAAPGSWLPASLAARLHALLPTHGLSGMGPISAWVSVVFVLGILSVDSETRDAMLGQGRALGWVSLASLLSVLALTTLGWSAALR